MFFSPLLQAFEARTMKSVMLDAMLKYNYWASMSSYMSRTTSRNAATINPDDISQSNFAYVGNGFDHQLIYNVPSIYKIIVRYSTQKVGVDIRTLAQNSNNTCWSNQICLGTNF